MTRWYREKKKEHYYKEAKKQGYRARSAFKLKQIQKKFNIMKTGDNVVDLGAAPGGWSEVAKETIGRQGTVIGVDLTHIQPIEGITFIRGDITDETTSNEIKSELNNEEADVVISDVSPDITGNYTMDQARSVWLAENALTIAKHILRSGGNFVCKLFEGEDTQYLVDKVEQAFSMVKPFSPKASRKSSSESYLIAKNFQSSSD